jgi:hypothetical protein
MILLKFGDYRLILGKAKGIKRRFYSVSAINQMNKRRL